MLVGGFNPFEKYLSNWIISQIGMKKKHEINYRQLVIKWRSPFSPKKKWWRRPKIRQKSTQKFHPIPGRRLASAVPKGVHTCDSGIHFPTHLEDFVTPVTCKNIWLFPKIGRVSPQIIPFVHRVWNHYFHHPFWGKTHYFWFNTYMLMKDMLIWVNT